MNNCSNIRIGIFALILLISSPIIGQEKLSAILAPRELHDLISKENIVIVDLRGESDYKDEHIPGSINSNRKLFENTELPYSGMMASKDKVEKILSGLGILPASQIIIYDESTSLDAARLWFVLKTYGHQKVQLLDGGIQLWKMQNFVVTKDMGRVNPSSYKFPEQKGLEYYATREEVKSVLKNQNVVILDVRSEREFSAGHIPGAIHLEWTNNLEKENVFKSSEALKEQFEKLGVTPDKQIITYCRSGVRAAHTGFILKDLLGYENVKIFDGSWIEWSHFGEEVEK
jgi:thiosulfate/3-mercaptopyruvate sulfurtransferase